MALAQVGATMATRVRAVLSGPVAAIAAIAGLAAAAAACGGGASKAAAPERPGLPAYWESQVADDANDAEDADEPAQPASEDSVDPGTYFEDWPNVNNPGAAGTEETSPLRVGPVTPPEGPDAQRPQRAIETDAPAGSPY